MVQNKKRKKISLKRILHGDFAGSLLEYGLIIGFSIVAFLIIAGIIMSILDWTQGNLSEFWSIFQR